LPHLLQRQLEKLSDLLGLDASLVVIDDVVDGHARTAKHGPTVMDQRIDLNRRTLFPIDFVFISHSYPLKLISHDLKESATGCGIVRDHGGVCSIYRVERRRERGVTR